MKKLFVYLFLLVSSVAQATVNTTINSITYTGNGATTNFSFSFAYPGAASSAASDFSVTTVVNGVTTVLPTNSYAITFNSPISPNPTGIGGSVLYPLSGPALVNGATLTITRTLPAIQGTSLSNQGILYPPTLEQEYDYLTMLIQQGLNSFNRAIVAPVGDPAGLNYILPAAAARAGELLCFDASGNVAACTVLPSGTVSSAMQPVVSAATLAAGRAAFGLGSTATTNVNCGLQSGVSAANNLDVNFTTTQVSTNQSIAASNCGEVYVATGPITFTLPRANTLWNGFGFWIDVAGGGSITLQINANDTIQSQTSGVSGFLPPGTWAYITTDAASFGNWRISIAQTYPGSSSAQTSLWAANYGAVCNAVTDDHVAFQNMLNAAQSTFASANFTGNCAITTGLTINTSAVTFAGVNPAVSILTAPPTINVISVGTNAGSTRLKDFEISEPTQAPCGGTSATGASAVIYTQANGPANIDDVWFVCAGPAVTFAGSSVFRANNMEVLNIPAGQYGIVISPSGGLESADGTITASRFTTTSGASAAILCQSCAGLRFENNKVNAGVSSFSSGFSLSLPAGGGDGDLFIVGNSFEGITGQSILLARAGSTGAFGTIVISANELTGTTGVSVPTDANGAWLTGLVVSGNIMVVSGAGTSVDSTTIVAITGNGVICSSGSTVPTAIGSAVNRGAAGLNGYGHSTAACASSTNAGTNVSTTAPY